MSQFLVQTNSLLDDALGELRRRLGLEEHQNADLLQKLTALASWIIRQAEAGRQIEAQEVLEHLGDVGDQQPQTRILLDDEEVRRLAEILDRGFAPTPALSEVLESLADPDYRPPELKIRKSSDPSV